MRAAIIKHLFRRNCWVSFGELVAVTQCDVGDINQLMTEELVELSHNHATGPEYRLIPQARGSLVSSGFDEYGAYGENNRPLEARYDRG